MDKPPRNNRGLVGSLRGQPTNCREPRSWGVKLEGLSRLPPDRQLDTLVNFRYRFKDFLSSSDRDIEATRRAISILEGICSALQPSPELMKLVSAVAFSDQFMLIQLPFFLSECAARNGDPRHLRAIGNLVSLLGFLQARLPATTAQKLVTLLPSLNMALEAVEKSGPSAGDLRARVSELETMKDSFLAEAHAREMIKQERLHSSEPPENFRDVPVIPLASELLSCSKPFLRPSLVHGAYANLDHYLDVQYRLLREDFVRPLREGLQKLLQSGMESLRIENINVYREVQVGDTGVTRGGITHKILFNASRFSRVRWDRTKRFMNGCLVCLSNDGFETISFATVVGRDPECLQVGELTVVFEDLFVEAVAWNRYTMIETQIYFEAYRHNLMALQEITAGLLPFYRYIVEASSDVRKPAYLDHDTVYDIGTLCKTEGMLHKTVRVLDENTWPPLEDLQLDASQLDAIKSSLLKEFSVIQGPPGTGKTYIGLKIVQVLLKNMHAWRGTGIPILVVCYTNHALDQFLEGILGTTKKIVRIGGRCGSEALQAYMLSKLRPSRYGDDDAEEECSLIQGKLQMLSEKLSAIYTVSCSFPCLERYMSLQVQNSFRGMPHAIREGFRTWLELDALKNQVMQLLAEDTQRAEQLELGADEAGEEDFDADEFQRWQDDDDHLYRGENAAKGDRREPLDSKEQAWCLHLYKLVSVGEKATDDFSVRDVWRLRIEDRWRLYRYWASMAVEELQKAVSEKKARLAEAKKRLEDECLRLDMACLQDVDVVGATTTGAAKHRALIQEMQPTVVIVEEAAEVLEAHVVTSLAPNTQHLILIGDHKQLRPSSAVYELSVRYNMDVSLFERMLTNGMVCRQLQVQHRMRPSFTRLLVPHFYKKLLNYSNVEVYEDIKGMDCNLFFISHGVFEADVEDSKSHTNSHEAEFLLCLAEYLLNQEYEPSQITILTTYSGQMFLMKEMAKGRRCSEVRITVVDNFQGEENDIILLSLVRSNPQQKVGFIKTPNRICVSLSRAKKGLYCIGNFGMIGESCQHWKDVMKELQSLNAVGEELRLRCQNHPDAVTAVKTSEDFSKVPEGGCGVPCSTRLSCGHSCGLPCHGYDRSHEMFKCMKPCVRKCPNNHGCELQCWQNCSQCTIPVLTEFERCGHRSEIPCHETANPRCPLPCPRSFECGHACPKKCGAVCPIRCVVTVSVKGKCGHDIYVMCYESSSDLSRRCKEPCKETLSCGHRCLLECKDLCQCKVMVTAVGECGHENQMPCFISQSPADITRWHCNHPCKKSLPCGHPCLLMCKEVCRIYCGTIVTVKCKNGHELEEACAKSKSFICKKKCDKTLNCGHKCKEGCYDPCTAQCLEHVDFRRKCGHSERVRCYQQDSKAVVERQCTTRVPAKCGSGHTVQVLCHLSTDAGTIQELCTAPCSEMLPCGHPCKGFCSKPCPLCPERCKFVCPHGPCKVPCGYPCLPCSLPCRWKCEHARCEASCSEPCTRQPCNEPCPKVLRCKHPCTGYCGEPCPKQCNVCPKAKSRSEPVDLDGASRFVLLVDCGHSVPDQVLAQLFDAVGEETTVPVKCPVCKRPISFNFRYGAKIRQYMEALNKKKSEILARALELEKERENSQETTEGQRVQNRRRQQPCAQRRYRSRGRAGSYGHRARTSGPSADRQQEDRAGPVQRHVPAWGRRGTSSSVAACMPSRERGRGGLIRCPYGPSDYQRNEGGRNREPIWRPFGRGGQGQQGWSQCRGWGRGGNA